MMSEIPGSIREKYKEAFEIDPLFLVEVTAMRGKWIDQSQSYNIFMKGVSGKLLHEIYFKAWRFGLKTTYYLRTLGASQIEKSTLDAKTFGFTQKRSYEAIKDANQQEDDNVVNMQAVSCNVDDPLSCESCQ
jgi:ribonucleoside-diphosphate reductase alpha chain